MALDEATCLFCREPGGKVLWRNPTCRVVWPEEPEQPGLCRVVYARHVAEMTDLDEAERFALAKVVFATERALRDTLRPDKMNLASLGNLVPHLHWHVIPRWRDDRHFPRPIWAEPMRPATLRQLGADVPQRIASALERILT